MPDLISDNADLLIALLNTAIDASLVPTMLNQRRDKSSTIPLTTSLTAAILWLLTAFVYASISLWIAMVAGIITGILWGIIGYQRFRYGEPPERPHGGRGR